MSVPPPERPLPPGWRRALREIAVDLSPLREHREFRLLFTGQLVSFAGSMITFVAVPFQVYELTRSSLAVGLLGLAEIVPILGLSLVGGALSDAIDRRRMLLWVESLSALAVAALAVNAASGSPSLPVVYAAAALLAGLYALQRPSLDALVPRLVPREQMAAALALNWLRGNLGQIAGPALGGLLLAAVGLSATYTIDCATFLAAVAAIAAMRAVPPSEDAPPPSVRSVVEGFRYARSRPELLGTYLVDMNAMFFAMPNALYPRWPPRPWRCTRRTQPLVSATRNEPTAGAA